MFNIGDKVIPISKTYGGPYSEKSDFDMFPEWIRSDDYPVCKFYREKGYLIINGIDHMDDGPDRFVLSDLTGGGWYFRKEDFIPYTEKQMKTNI